MNARSVAAMGVFGLLLLPGVVPAQPDSASNDLFVELVGSAPVGSVNYERLVGADFRLRIGVGYLRATSFLGSDLDRVQFPVVLNPRVRLS